MPNTIAAVEKNVRDYYRVTGRHLPALRECSRAHRYAAYLPRCPWCASIAGARWDAVWVPPVPEGA